MISSKVFIYFSRSITGPEPLLPQAEPVNPHGPEPAAEKNASN